MAMRCQKTRFTLFMNCLLQPYPCSSMVTLLFFPERFRGSGLERSEQVFDFPNGIPCRLICVYLCPSVVTIWAAVPGRAHRRVHLVCCNRIGFTIAARDFSRRPGARCFRTGTRAYPEVDL